MDDYQRASPRTLEKQPAILIQTMSRSSTYTLIRISTMCILVVFVMNFVVLSMYLPAASSSAEHSPGIGQQKHITDFVHSSSIFPPKSQPNNWNSVVQPWGCAVFPPEYTAVYNKTMRQQQPQKRRRQGHMSLSSSTSFSASSSHSYLLTKQGKSHRENQDRGLLVRPFNVHTDLGNDRNNSDDFLMGVFDGHGEYGHKVSQRCIEMFPKILWDKLTRRRLITGATQRLDLESTYVRNALNESFWELDRNGVSPDFYMGGTTSTVALRLGDKLYVANTGDSQTIVVSCTASSSTFTSSNNVTTSVLYASTKDKPNLVEERQRILARGGVIGPNGGRVIVHTSAVRRDTIGLAMSRSIGDWEWGDVGVIPEPRIHVVDLKPYLNEQEKKDGRHSDVVGRSLFVMSASDGIWDYRPRPHFFAKQFCDAFMSTETGTDKPKHEQNHSNGINDGVVNDDSDDFDDDINRILQRKLMEVMDVVTPTIGYQDDMTAIIVKVL